MHFSNVRHCLGGLAGKRLVDITQDDWEDVRARTQDGKNKVQRIHLHFEDGSTVIFPASSEGQGFTYDKIPSQAPDDPLTRLLLL